MKPKRRPPKVSHSLYLKSKKSGKRKAYWDKANKKVQALQRTDKRKWRSYMVRNSLRIYRVPGGLELAEQLVINAFNMPCRYCFTTMTYDIMSVDRADPLIAGDLNNIEIICRDCNFRKGCLTREEYRYLLDCFNKNATALRIFCKRTACKGFIDAK